MKCNRLGCTAPGTGGGRCDKHKPTSSTATPYKRVVREHHSLYNTSQWKRMRQQILGPNPLCCRCGYYGFTTSAVDVDHIIPHKGDPALFYDMNNLQPLCKKCHSWKTQRELQHAHNPKSLKWL